MPSISIIIPTLNEVKLIRQILDQFDEKVKDNFNLEIIVSDGGSIDGTIEIAKSYTKKVIIHKGTGRQNISEGRNRGAQISDGDVLIFFNADTTVSDMNIFLKEAVESVMQNGVAAVACPVRVFPDEEKFSDKIFHRSYNFYVKILNKFFMGMGRGECHIITRKNFFEIGGYNENLSAGEDFDLYKRLRKLGKIFYNDKLLVFESPRRYRKFGYLKVFFDWLKNSVWVIIFKRSISEIWTEVR